MNTLKDLNKYLFDEMDRLVDTDDLESEIKRANTICEISEQIISAHKTQLDAVKLVAEYKGLGDGQTAPIVPAEVIQIGG